MSIHDTRRKKERFDDMMPRAPADIFIRVPSQRAFTLIELIVVVILITIAASLVVPRMFSSSSRLATTEAKRASTLLTIAAEKSMMTMQPIAVDFDISERRLQMLIQRPAPVASGSGSQAVAAPIWRPDSLVEPVQFDHLDLSLALADGRPMDQRRWRVVFAAGQARPALLLRLVPRGKTEPVQELSLGTADATASLVSIGETSTARNERGSASSRTIDLDDSGKGAKPW